MAQPSIDEACWALAAVVGSIAGLRAKSYIDDTINPDEAHVFTREFDPRYVFADDRREYHLGVRVYVSKTDVRSAQVKLRKYMEPAGSTSVRAKIEDGDSWSVTIDYASVTSVSQPFEVVFESGVYLAVDWDVDVVW